MTFPYTFPFTFPTATTVSTKTATLPIAGWWAELAGSASVNVTPTAAAATAHLAIAGTLVTPTAAASGFLSMSQPAAATITPTSSAVGVLTLAQSASAAITPTAVAAGHLSGQGLASAAVTPTAGAAGTATGPATATVTPGTTAAGHLNYTGSAASLVTPTTTAAGLLKYIGSAAGTVTPVAAATGSLPTTVAFDALGGGYLASSPTGTTTPSWSHTNAGNGAVVFVELFCASASPTVTATFGGTAMTAGPSVYYFFTSGYYAYVYSFYLQSPPTGSQTVALSLSAGSAYDVAANSVSYTGVTGFGTGTTNLNSTGSNPSMTASSASGQMVANAFGGYTTAFSAYSGNSRWNQPLGSASLSFLIGDAAGASTVTLSATGSQPWGGVAIPVL